MLKELLAPIFCQGGNSMSRTNLDLAKRLALDVTDGNAEPKDLAFCITVLISEVEELKKKVM